MSQAIFMIGYGVIPATERGFLCRHTNCIITQKIFFFLSPLQLFHQLEYFFHLHILLPDLFSLIGFTLRIPNSSRTKTPIYNTISHTLRVLTTLSPDNEVERRKEQEIWRRVVFFSFFLYNDKSSRRERQSW